MDRRAFLGVLATALGSTAVLGAAASDAASASDAPPSAQKAFLRFVDRMECRRVAPQPLVDPSQAANGGLMYGVTEHAAFGGAGIAVIQRCARIADLPEKGRFGVLPEFTVAGIAHPSPPSKSAGLAMLISFLTREAGLPLKRLSFTTTRLSKEDLALLESLGITRIRLRDVREAKDLGDGSGWFTSPISGFSAATTSVEFTRAGRTVELGEAIATACCVGLERLQWAMGGSMKTWRQALPATLAAIQEQSGDAGVPAYAILAASA